MRRAFDRGIAISLGAFAVLLMLNAGLSFWNTRRLAVDQGWVAHTHEVLALTGEVFSTLKDAETGQRGFLITGDDRFLAPYQAALDHVEGRLAKLRVLTADNLRQQARILDLERIAAARLALLKEGIVLRRRKGFAAAQAFLLEGKGLVEMDAARTLVAQIESDEKWLLRVRSRQSEQSYRMAIVTGPIASLLGLASAFALAWLLRRHLRARQTAAAALEFQGRMLDAVGQAAIATDPEGRIIYWNRFAETLYGWSRDEALGRDLIGLVVASGAVPRAEEIMSLLRSRTSWSGEFPVRRRDGTTFPALVTDTPILDERGRLRAVIGISSDLTEQKRIEEALRRDERTARFLADASAALSDLLDYESTLQKIVSLAVPVFADWCAVDMREGEGGPRRLAVTHSDPEKMRLAHELFEKYPPRPDDPHGIAKVLGTGASEYAGTVPDSLLAALAHDDEHLRLLRSLGLKSFIRAPLRSRAGTLGVFTFAMAESDRRYDADDLRVAEDIARRATVAMENADLYRALQAADLRKDEFLATLAHELRNPLAPIRNSLEIMARLKDDPESMEQARSIMERQLTQMVSLIDDLMDVSRISRDKLQLRKERVELAAVVRSAVEAIDPLVAASGHELIVALPAEPVWLLADPTRLAQVLSNLLNNSAKYTEPGGRITLAAERQGSDLVVAVRDTGLGIPAEMLPRIFDMFAQVDRSLERAQGGLGIGLTLVKRLVEMHGGTIEAHSEGVGRGSEFVVRLPVLIELHEPEPPVEPSGNGESAAAAPQRILVVDDNHDSARSLARLLKLVGNEVRTAHDGLEAVETATSFRPEVVLLDIGLPKLNGYDVARRIRQEPWGREMVLIALTGWGQDEDRRRSEEAGFNDHLVKPVNPDALLKLLQEWQRPRHEDRNTAP